MREKKSTCVKEQTSFVFCNNTRKSKTAEFGTDPAKKAIKFLSKLPPLVDQQVANAAAQCCQMGKFKFEYPWGKIFLKIFPKKFGEI